MDIRTLNKALHIQAKMGILKDRIGLLKRYSEFGFIAYDRSSETAASDMVYFMHRSKGCYVLTDRYLFVGIDNLGFLIPKIAAFSDKSVIEPVIMEYEKKLKSLEAKFAAL